MLEFRELFVGELKTAGFSASDAEDVADWYLGASPGTPFPAHCCRVALGVDGYDPSQPRNANGEWTKGGGARAREHRDKGFQDRYGNGNPETLAANPEMNIERGKAVFTRLARKQSGYEPHAMYRKGLGWIGVDAGTAGNPKPYDGPNENLKGRTFLGGSGIAHILAKHPGAEKHIAETLQYGEMFRNLDNATGLPNERKITIIHGNSVAIVSKHHDGRMLITNFFEDKPDRIAAMKTLGPYHAKGENK